MEGFIILELRTKKQIEKLKIRKDQPLFICDADEVILYFAKHFKEFLESHGWNLNLTGYRLDNAIFNERNGRHPNKNEAKKLVEKFIREETVNQKAIDKSILTLKRISALANIVILTNVPDYAHRSRERNFKALGMKYPIISNSGPKGFAIKHIVKDISSPCFFVDDSPFQIESASKENPNVTSIHFSACNIVQKVLPKSPFATYSPKTWEEVFSIVYKEISKL